MIWLFTLCLVSLPAGFTSLARLPYQAYNCCLLGLPARVSGWLFSVSAVFLIDNTKVQTIEMISKLFRKKDTQKDTPSIWVPLHFLQSYNLTRRASIGTTLLLIINIL